MKAIIQEKQAIVDIITEEIKSNQSMVVVEYRGLTVAKLEDLRRQLRKEKVSVKVYKNTLVSRAAKSLGYDALDNELTGPNAIIFSKEDPIAGPRVLSKYARRNKEVVIKGGVFEGKVLTKEEIATVATLPGRAGLISMLLSCLNSPISSFAATVQAIADSKSNQ